VLVGIAFDVLPDLTISSVQRQSLMPGDSSLIHYTLTNPAAPWTPPLMTVHTHWSDSCGGTFAAADAVVTISHGTTTGDQVVTYTAPAEQPEEPTQCTLTLTMNDDLVTSTYTVDVWIDPPMIMFVSSVPILGGDFHGLWQAADSFCQSLADASELPKGTFRALLGFDEITAKDRLIDLPYVRPDGTPIARNKAELFSIDLLNAVQFDEQGTFAAPVSVYTGTLGNGLKGENCNNWTSSLAADNATTGVNYTTLAIGWTNSGPRKCNTLLPIYCVQQPPGFILPPDDPL
jgi:hypothetical protein